MNPSASGWIRKFGVLVKNTPLQYNSSRLLYYKLRDSGFAYGLNHAYANSRLPVIKELSTDEKAKVNLFTALYGTWHLGNHGSFDLFLQTLNRFYQELDFKRKTYFLPLSSSKKTDRRLERLLHSRVYYADKLFKKNTNKMLNHALLYVDVLAFDGYLHGKVQPKTYSSRLEEIIINVTYQALNSKKSHSVYDTQLLNLFKTSIRYTGIDPNGSVNTYKKQLEQFSSFCEKQYLLDLALLASQNTDMAQWENSRFLSELHSALNMNDRHLNHSFLFMLNFFEKHQKKIHHLQTENPVQQIYGHSVQMVRRLILRNQHRLLKELAESRELVQLIGKSATHELTDAEREKIKEQLLDIFKSLPSFAIFILPGGTLLLPIFVKFIPKLLPSAFDDNRVDEKKRET